MEKCFLFDKNIPKVKNYFELINSEKLKHDKIIQKTIEIFNIPIKDTGNETIIKLSNNCLPLIRSDIALKYNFMNKLYVLDTKPFLIYDDYGKIIAKWCEIGYETLEFKEISEFIDRLDLYKDNNGENYIPNAVNFILNNYRYIGKYCALENYGIFFLINNEKEINKFKETFKEAIEYPISDFYTLKSTSQTP